MSNPLEFIPVKHTCDHFELRLTRWYEIADREVGYVTAGNACTACKPQGRPLQPCYPSLEVAQRYKPILDAARTGLFKGAA